MSNSSLPLLNYKLQGSSRKPVLVFLHGFCEDLSMWDEVLEKGFEAYRLLCIDLPGFGASAPQANGSIEQMGKAVIDLIDHLAIEQFILFGHSMGGYVALTIASKVPNRLKGFGLIHSHPFADSEQGKSNRQKSIDFIEAHGSSLFIKELIPKLFPKKYVGSHSFLVNKLIFNANSFPAVGIQNGLQAMKERPDQTEVMRHFRIPILCLVGALDELLPLKQLIDQANFAPITDLRILQTVGHMGPYENPKAIRKCILPFLNNLQILSN